MCKVKLSEAEKTVEAFYKSSFTTYLSLNFLQDFIEIIGGADVFLSNIDNLIVDDVDINALSSGWLDSSLELFDNHKDICMDSAGYWEFNGDKLMTAYRLNAIKSIDMMLLAVNRKLKKLEPSSDITASSNQVRESLLIASPHWQRSLLDKLVAEYCVSCVVAISCWSFKSFLREG